MDQAGVVVVLEHLAITRPFNGHPQHPLGLLGFHALAEQLQEGLFLQLAVGLLLQAVADEGGQRYMLHQLQAEHLAAEVVAAFDVGVAQRRHQQVAAAELGQAEAVQRIGQRQHLLVGELALLDQLRQVGTALELVVREQLQQALHATDIGLGQAVGQMRARRLVGRAGHRGGAGHQPVDLVDQQPHLGAVGAARARQRDRQLGPHPARVAGEHQHAVGHHHGLLDVVRDD
mmetsp:Transcript_21629/g.51432  ORF Transcript_21629/g.51432 Transcript_21629/m.51432 type:complete len:231 (-) Transcript_21629:269-961(-)